MGVYWREDGVKIEGYMDSAFQPILAMLSEDATTTIKPARLADKVPKKRTIWVVEIGTVIHQEQIFLDNVVQLCDFIGLPFIQDIKYSIIRRCCS